MPTTNKHTTKTAEQKTDTKKVVSAKTDSVIFESINAAVTDVCTQNGVSLIALEIRGSKERRIVEVYVDKPDGISLDECSNLSEIIGEALESIKAFPAAYRLDVSSPGIERPLRFMWQYTRNVGRLLTVTTQDGNTLKGRISATEGNIVTLESPVKAKSSKNQKQNLHLDNPRKDNLPKTTGFPIVLDISLIKTAVVELEF